MTEQAEALRHAIVKTEMKRKKLKLIIPAIVLVVGGAIVIVAGLLLFKTEPYVMTEAPLNVSTDQPSENRPEAESFVWQGAPTDPKKVTMETIAESGFIQKVAVDQFGRIAVPDNIFIAGWFVDSVRPGEKGLSILDGHVNGRNVSEGLFARLAQLKQGDPITITMGDDSVRTFAVETVDSVPVEKAADLLYRHDSKIESQLNLITCAGNYSEEIDTFTERVIVTARLTSEPR